MKDIGGISLHNLSGLITAVSDPWIVLGILFLIAFFAAYMSALSWADLTYVLPATAFGYVVTAFLSRVFLHEAVSPWRWAGVLLITCGVGLVARGPSLTVREPAHKHDHALADNQPLAADQQLARSKEQHELA